MVKNGWVVYNGHLPGTKFKDFAEWIQAAANEKNIQLTLIKNNEMLALHQQTGGTIFPEYYRRPDFVVFGDKDIHLAKQLELLGIPVFNSAEAISLCDDKIATYQALSAHHLPIPKSIAGPKIFPNPRALETASFIKSGKMLGYPLVIKEAFGSFGEQVYLVETEQELIEKVVELQDRPFILQEFISSSYGKDVRLNVVGDKVVAAMKRTSSNDFRANVSAGGSMEEYQPTKKEIELAIAASRAVGTDFAGVDLLFGPEETPLVCEVNSNAHIRNIFDCTRINVADWIIDYIVEKLQEG
ncbi:ATP-grasp domain-containing protein [Sediminibacillus halophilus]|uniref:Ribosomal protein S6--L-glutamate ligase/gamma-F420-2:alpha-L-glutamate ligase n=1 Tax=Sediminibacillus halophilus TaxID=482461 RepID=A0A1G9XNG2_9BACI|nr:RimK family alpha-L-glutamate ligase [Sediminibacillus halophilus]SDM98031.1 ribosomal protein S6--L-glutamate ligase/gamma-F420-2:alpha-L-glutamate ligase [Sediminibacillus halophilus]